MKLNFFGILMIVILLMGCDKKKKIAEDDVPTYSLVGTWETTSLHAKYYENGELKIDTIIRAPYPDNAFDIIDYVRFTADTFYFHVINDAEEAGGYKYFIRGKFLFVTDGVDTDTAWAIDKLNATEYDFSFEEIENNGNGKSVHSYTSKKK